MGTSLQNMAKAVAKKSAPKKAPVKKTVAKKPAAKKKTAAKKPAAKKTAKKKTPAKKKSTRPKFRKHPVSSTCSNRKPFRVWPIVGQLRLCSNAAAPRHRGTAVRRRLSLRER